jgi:hypothetical protein
LSDHSIRFLVPTKAQRASRSLINIKSKAAGCRLPDSIGFFHFHEHQYSDYFFVPAQKTQRFCSFGLRIALALASKTARNHDRFCPSH